MLSFLEKAGVTWLLPVLAEKYSNIFQFWGIFLNFSTFLQTIIYLVGRLPK